MMHSVKDVMARYKVGEHTVLGWIRNGELSAINISRALGRRPKFAITADALQAFEILRTTEQPTPRRTRRKREATAVYY